MSTPVARRDPWHVAVRHHTVLFCRNVIETLTVEIVVLGLLHITPAAVAAVILVR